MSPFGDLLAPRYLVWLLQGFGATLVLSASMCVAGTALGLAFCCPKEAGGRFVKARSTAFINLTRNTPLLVQLLLWYFSAVALMPSWLTA
ncbi:ABC transporter permease subunit [Methylobacterium sp. CM6246]